MGAPYFTTIRSVRAGTGYLTLSPPWNRQNVRWFGRGIYVLRLATSENSRWLVGAHFPWRSIYAHEKTFSRLSEEKLKVFKKVKINLWPTHMVCEKSYTEWRSKLNSLVLKQRPLLDTGHLTLWKLKDESEFETLFSGPLIVLDGHHSRRAQRIVHPHFTFGWVEPLDTPSLQVKAIHRAGDLAKIIDVSLKEGKLQKLSKPPEFSKWTMDHSLAFEVYQSDKRYWVEFALKKNENTTVVEKIAELVRGRGKVQTTSIFEEALVWLQENEVNTVLKLPPPTKEFIRSRALQRHLLPQKATYFYPKIPFGVLVEDLS